jgi:hypothetical protein
MYSWEPQFPHQEDSYIYLTRCGENYIKKHVLYMGSRCPTESACPVIADVGTFSTVVVLQFCIGIIIIIIINYYYYQLLGMNRANLTVPMAVFLSLLKLGCKQASTIGLA